ncbi:hypothetical protein NECID01_1537 [Nematocida sp. AWRm77]|nr:hypothetical protein NECID01_1537 [Nematocida sp. AWRm77]
MSLDAASTEKEHENNSRVLASKSRRTLPAEIKENLYKTISIETEKMKRGEKIDEKYLFLVPCAHCGNKTISDGQIPTITRKCKVCYIRQGMNAYFKQLLEGPTPFGEQLRQFLITESEEVCAYISKHKKVTVSDKTDIESEEDSNYISSDTSVPEESAVESTPAQRTNTITICKEAAKRVSSREETTKDLVIDGLKETIRLSGASEEITAFLLYVKEKLSVYAQQHLTTQYKAQTTERNMNEAEETKEEYVFIRNTMYEVLEEYTEQVEQAKATSAGTKTIPYISLSRLERENLEYLIRKEKDVANNLEKIKNELASLRKGLFVCASEKEKLKKDIMQIPRFQMPSSKTKEKAKSRETDGEQPQKHPRVSTTEENVGLNNL